MRQHPSVPESHASSRWHRILHGCCVCVAALVMGAKASQAQTADYSVPISYLAPAECPSREELLLALRARTRELYKTELDTAQRISIRVAAQAAGYVGLLTIFIGGDPVLERSLEDVHCGALVEGLALVAAMALTPTLGPRPSHAPANPISTTTQEPESKTPILARAETAGHYDLMLAVLGGLQTAPTPDTLLSAGIHVGLRRRNRAQSVGMSLQYGQTDRLHFLGGDVRFRWLVSRIIGCPLGFRHRALAIMACGAVEVGLLRGEPANTDQSTVRNGLWLAPGLGAAMSMQHAGMVLEMFGGAMRPLVRDHFFFAGSAASGSREVVHHPPALGLAAELKLGVLF